MPFPIAFDTHVCPYVQRFRESEALIIAVGFLAVMIDMLTDACLIVVLPCMLTEIEDGLICDRNSTGLVQVTGHTGLLLCLKPIIETFGKPLFGYLDDRIGHHYPLLLGCFLNIGAAIGLALVNSFPTLIVARIVQSIGGSLSVVASYALVFDKGTDRSKALGIVNIGYLVGSLVGPPLGGLINTFGGTYMLFLLLAALNLLDGIFRALVKISPSEHEHIKNGSGFKELLTDVFVLLGIGQVFIVEIIQGLFLGTFPSYVMTRLKSKNWQLGVLLLPTGLIACVGQFIATRLEAHIPLWVFATTSMACTLVYISLPFIPNLWLFIIPDGIGYMGISISVWVVGVILSTIVQKRHNKVYGRISGLLTATLSVGTGLGFFVGGYLVPVIGFDWIYWGISIICGIYAIAATGFKFDKDLERPPPSKDEELKDMKEVLVSKSDEKETKNYGTDPGTE